MGRRKSSGNCAPFICTKRVKITMDTTIMRMLKNSFDKCCVGFVKLTKAYNLLCDRVRMVRKKSLCKGGRIRTFCPVLRKTETVKHLCYRCSGPRLNGNASDFLYFFK